ncbi:MAG: phosphoribosylglycinamide formyltransferase [Bauldia sp.]
MARKKVAVLISGRGSNMAALIAAARKPDYPAEIVLVVSSRAGVAGIERAAAEDVATAVVDAAATANQAAFEAAVEERLAGAGVEIVCLAGFMRLLSASFVDRWRDRLVNIHPSLLPAFQGLNTHARAIAAGVRLHGCTVHFVRPAMDDGPIIAQAAVPVLPDDTAQTLAERVLAAEHRLYPQGLALVAAERTRVVGETVVIADLPPQPSLAMLMSPGAF